MSLTPEQKQALIDGNFRGETDITKEVPSNYGYVPEDIVGDLLLDIAFDQMTHPKKQPSEIVEIKNEPAVILVVSKTNGALKYISNKFILTDLQEARNEKVQILETFGEPHVSFFGERVKTYQGAGVLLEASSRNLIFPHKYRWASGFAQFYERVLRGSQLVKEDQIAILDVGNNILRGYFLNLVMNTNSQTPNKKQFSFNFLVSDHRLRLASELDILYGVFQQMRIENRHTMLQKQTRLKEITEQIEELEATLRSPIVAAPEPIVTAPAFSSQSKENYLNVQIETLNSERDQLIKDIRNLFTANINENLEG